MYDEKKITQLKNFNKRLIFVGSVMFFGTIIIKIFGKDQSLFEELEKLCKDTFNIPYIGLLWLTLGLYINSKLVKRKNKSSRTKIK